jgi:hypothetical protein
MANDLPSHLRMGFGFGQAKAAGAPYAAPATADQMNFHLKERAAERKLRDLRIKYPEIGPLIREYVQYEKDGCHLPAQRIFILIKCEIASRSENSFVVHGTDGKSYAGEKVNEIYLDALSFVHEGKTTTFQIGCIKDITVD